MPSPRPAPSLEEVMMVMMVIVMVVMVMMMVMITMIMMIGVWPVLFFPLARNSHAQSISSASCHSKRRLAIPNGARASRLTIQLLKPNADPVVLT